MRNWGTLAVLAVVLYLVVLFIAFAHDEHRVPHDLGELFRWLTT